MATYWSFSLNEFSVNTTLIPRLLYFIDFVVPLSLSYVQTPWTPAIHLLPHYFCQCRRFCLDSGAYSSLNFNCQGIFNLCNTNADRTSRVFRLYQRKLGARSHLAMRSGAWNMRKNPKFSTHARNWIQTQFFLQERLASRMSTVKRKRLPRPGSFSLETLIMLKGAWKYLAIPMLTSDQRSFVFNVREIQATPCVFNSFDSNGSPALALVPTCIFPCGFTTDGLC